MFLRVCFKKICGFVNLFVKLSSSLNNLNIRKMIYHHFLLNLLKIEIFCLLLFGSIIVKMDNFHLFEEVFKFLIHA
jgi:hypothetical protein